MPTDNNRIENITDKTETDVMRTRRIPRVVFFIRHVITSAQSFFCFFFPSKYYRDVQYWKFSFFSSSIFSI